MIRLIKIVFLASLAIALTTISMANREAATLTLLPDVISDGIASILNLEAPVNFSITLPMFVIVFGAIVAGLLIGFFWEWLREAKHRQEVNKRQRQVVDLKREVNRLRGKVHEGDDEVLALLEETEVKKAS